MNKEEKRKMRKTNMRIFPTYKKLGWDYLFFYTIDFLFLTQVKGMYAADVVLKNSFFALFCMLLQIPANLVIEFLGKKNSLIFANVINCFYIVIMMISRNLGDLIFAEFISAMAVSIKSTVEPIILNEAIPPSKFKAQIYSKINARGMNGYYTLDAISKIIGGYLFTINGYLPMICSLIILIIVVILSLCFIEPVKKKKIKKSNLLVTKELNEIKDGFTYVFKSERLKALILATSLITALITVISNYSISLFEDLKLPATTIGIIVAIGSLVSARASILQGIFQKTLKNKTIITISMMLSVSCLISGICGLGAENFRILLGFIIISHLLYSFGNGMFNTIVDRYLRSFSNEQIETKIFAAKNLFRNMVRVVIGFFASFILDKMSTAWCMIIMGIIFTIIYYLMEKYMKERVGLKPEEYPKEETKYDEQKELIK